MLTLVAGRGCDFSGRSADEDAAYGVVADPELGLDLEVLVGVFVHQEAVALVCGDHAVGQLQLASRWRSSSTGWCVEQRRESGGLADDW